MSTTSNETHFSDDGRYHDLPYSAPLERVSANKLSPYDVFLADPTFLTALPHDHFIATSSSCSICTDHSVRPTVSTTCKHIFHNMCLGTWLRELAGGRREGTCPYCRNVLFKDTRESEGEQETWREGQMLGEHLQDLALRTLMYALRQRRMEARGALLRYMDLLMSEFEQEHDDTNMPILEAAPNSTTPMPNHRSDIDSPPVPRPWAPTAIDTVRTHAATYPDLDRVRERAAEADREHVRRIRRQTSSSASTVPSRSPRADPRIAALSRDRYLRAQDIRDDIMPRRGIAIANQDDPFTLENIAVEQELRASRDAASSASRAHLRRRPAQRSARHDVLWGVGLMREDAQVCREGGAWQHERDNDFCGCSSCVDGR
jgi:hypothetical protein